MRNGRGRLQGMNTASAYRVASRTYDPRTGVTTYIVESADAVFTAHSRTVGALCPRCVVSLGYSAEHAAPSVRAAIRRAIARAIAP